MGQIIQKKPTMSYDWIMAILAAIICFRLATSTLHLNVRMVSFIALYAPNPGVQIGTTLYFVNCHTGTTVWL